MIANLRHLPEVPILYSFRRCPYAMRARLGLWASGLKVELREIHLRHKPEHMVALSPKATVPVLWLSDGTVVDESLDVMLYALGKKDPWGWLDLSESQMADAKGIVATLDGPFKHHLDRYKYSSRYETCDPLTHRAACEVILLDWSARIERHGGGLIRAKPCFADYAVLPFIRQFRIASPDFFDALEQAKPLQEWLQNYLDSELFKAIMGKYEPWKVGDHPVYFGRYQSL